MIINVKPYRDIETGDNWVVREFSQEIDPIELLWHRDDETRIIESLRPTDWQIQLDNELPKEIIGKIEIKRHDWHRVVKGSGNLLIKIIKIQDEI